MKTLTALLAAAVLGSLVGCDQTAADANNAATNNSGTTTNASEMTNSSTNAASTASQSPQSSQWVNPSSRKPQDGEEVAVMDTSMGQIVLMFFPDKAPKHVENFKSLAKKGFYDGTLFHRVIPDFMIQGGDPNTKNADRTLWGQGGPETNVKAEFNDIDHVRGVLSMARSNHPDSAGSQFFIVHQHSPHLNGQYTAFGQAVSGLEVVDKIVAQRTEGGIVVEHKPAAIKSVKIVKWPVK